MQSPSLVLVGYPWDERDGRGLATSLLCAAIGKQMKPSSPIMAWFLPCQKVVCTRAGLQRGHPPRYRATMTGGPECSTCAQADPNVDRCAYLSPATSDRPPRNRVPKRNDRLNIRHVAVNFRSFLLESCKRAGSRGMLGRRGRFHEEKVLTAIVFTSIYEQDAWMTADGGCCAPHAYDDSWPHFSFFGMFCHTQTELPCPFRPPAGPGCVPRVRDGPVTIGFKDKTGLYATPDVDLGRIQFMDRFSLNGHAAALTQGLT